MTLFTTVRMGCAHLNWTILRRAGPRTAPGQTFRHQPAENATAHALRYVEEAGLSRGTVQEAVTAHVNTIGKGMSPGRLTSQTIRVRARSITYNAYVLQDGSINVGRIIIR